MNLEQRKEIISRLRSDEDAIMAAKGKSYAGTGDTLANFKRNALALGLSPYQIWAVYFNKHIDSINNAIKADPKAPVDYSEGLRGRIMDARIYLEILACMLEEDSHAGT